MQRIVLTSHLAEPFELSQIVYGMWRLANDQDTSPAHIQAKIEACLNQGITSFDQADIYGGYRCEQLLGAALKDAPHLRDKMEIITKCDILLMGDKFPERRVKYYDTSAEHITASIDQSLVNMNIDQIDCLLVHRPDPLMDHVETGAALDSAVASGKVRTIGVSNFKPHDWNLLQSAMTTPLVTNQIEISLTAPEAFTNGDLAFHQLNGIHPMAWSPLGGGALFDQDTSQLEELRHCLTNIANAQQVGIDAVATAWLLKHPSGILPVMGTNNLERIKKLSDATKVEIDRPTWFEIYVAAMGHEVP
ncbi:MAG: oxidoreductase [Rhizobiaceae bacterium]|nr:oxidoreductase [Rhizobiaceae bacterium]